MRKRSKYNKVRHKPRRIINVISLRDVNANQSRIRAQKYTVASIHATILAIFIGIFSAYSIYIKTIMAQIESRAIEEASKINRVTVTFSSGFIPISKIMDNKKLLNDVNGDCENEEAVLGSKEKAREFASKIYTLFCIYPFPHQIVGKQNEMYASLGDPVRSIHFGSIKDIVTWQSHLSELTLSIEKCKDKIQSAFLEIQEPSVGIDENPLYEMLDSARKVNESVQPILQQYDGYKFILPSGLIAIFILICSGITFASGVLLPLIVEEPNRLCIIFIPTIFYVFIFLFILFTLIDTL